MVVVLEPADIALMKVLPPAEVTERGDQLQAAAALVGP
jgi:hypothetical protein